MINVHFIIHEAFEGMGAFERWIAIRNYKASFSRVYEYEKLPDSIDNLDLLVIMGGTQGPDTQKATCPYFDAEAEIGFIQKFIRARKAVVGVCLGAQLVGSALGARHEKSTESEIGNFPITKTDIGKKNAKFSQFPDNVIVGHWHNDMPGLTENAKIIAFNEACPRQIIEYSDFVYGLQCHLEFTRDSVKQLIQHAASDFERLKSYPYIQSPEQLKNYDYEEMNSLLFSFLDKLIEHYCS